MAQTAPRQSAPSSGTGEADALDTAPVSLKRILVALDASDHADRALAEAVRLAGPAGGSVTGIHAYAAKLHDRRFRQMEGGLPERYRRETEMERQREVHDDLITRGLGVISDSYHDTANAACEAAGVPYRRLSPEGKNYRRIVDAAASGDFDLLALGALGLGAVPGGAIGTVCERVVRRCPIDVVVIRDPGRALGDGPLVVGIDGSRRSFGALRTALDLGRRLSAPVHAVAAYDPYFHYVAFNRISGVLSEEAGRTFRFKEQEKLHEEIIDSGIATIYRSHLELARSVAADAGVALTCELLDGKPYQVIARYLEKVGASLLLVGKTGIHADPDLDIGGNAENLLRDAPCHVWLGQVTYSPPLEAVARETITWTEEAEDMLTRVPETARAMVRMAILRLAQESGHTVVTSALIEEATERFCPERGGTTEAPRTLAWSEDAARLLETVGDPAAGTSIRLRAEKNARRQGASEVRPEHVRLFLDDDAAPRPSWNAAALARLSRVPEAERESVRKRIEADSRARGLAEITAEAAEAGIAAAAAAGDEAPAPSPRKAGGGCPFGHTRETTAPEPTAMEWSAAAEAKMERVPEGFMRAMTRRRIEAYARRHGVGTITPDLIDEKYAEWGGGSARQSMSLEWDKTALERIGRIPDFVRGMVVLEVERCAREMGRTRVTRDVIDGASRIWEEAGLFHSEHDPALYKRRDG